MKTRADKFFAMPEPEFRVAVQKAHRDYIYNGPTTHAQMKAMVHLWVHYIRNMHHFKDGKFVGDWIAYIKFYGWLIVKGWVL